MKKIIIVEKKLKKYLKEQGIYYDFLKNIKFGGYKEITRINEAFNFSECVYPKRIKNLKRFWENWDERYTKTIINFKTK